MALTQRQTLRMLPVLQVLHFGDYDPVGLAEFCRLRDALGDRAQLYIPHGLRGLFERVDRVTNRKLLEAKRNQETLAGLRKGISLEMDEVLDLLMDYGPLEQEAVFC